MPQDNITPPPGFTLDTNSTEVKPPTGFVLDNTDQSKKKVLLPLQTILQRIHRTLQRMFQK